MVTIAVDGVLLLVLLPLVLELDTGPEIGEGVTEAAAGFGRSEDEEGVWMCRLLSGARLGRIGVDCIVAGGILEPFKPFKPLTGRRP
jgi:hypothetical protein